MRLSNRKPQRGDHADLEMTSMIDVVFLLLIFFMTTASFVRTERVLPTETQVKKKSTSKSQSDLEPAIVEIVPSTTTQQFVFKLGTLEVSADDELQGGQLTGVLQQFPNKAEGAFVRVSDGAPFRMAAAAIQACRKANFLTVSYVPIPSN